MNEKKQDYKTHRRIVPGFHMVTSLLALSIFVGGLIQCFCDCPRNLFSGLLFAVTGLTMIFIAFYARQFATKVQDRAIRAEENFRHFILAGKPLDSRLKPSQIVALRFASDAEFPALAMKAAEQNIKNDDIKKLIQVWRADHHRV
jgi:hypothetical protein